MKLGHTTRPTSITGAEHRARRFEFNSNLILNLEYAKSIFVQVSKALVHPGYDSRVLANDIALLVLETRAQVGGFISLKKKELNVRIFF